MLSQILAQVLPALIDTLTPILVAVLVGLIYRWTGIQIEQKHMLALQSALQNGARLLLKPDASIEDAIGYVQRSVPDALAKFQASDPARITELLAPHIAALPKPRLAAAYDRTKLDEIKADILGTQPGVVG